MIPIGWHFKLLNRGYRKSKKGQTYYKKLNDAIYFLSEPFGSNYKYRYMTLSCKPYEKEPNRENVERVVKSLVENGILFFNNIGFSLGIRGDACQNCEYPFTIDGNFCSKPCKKTFVKKYGDTCIVCSKLCLSNTHVCSDSCYALFCETDDDHICKACFCPIYESHAVFAKSITINHHVTYFPEELVPVHTACHSEIHNSWEYPHLRPIEGDAKKFYSKPTLRKAYHEPFKMSQ